MKTKINAIDSAFGADGQDQVMPAYQNLSASKQLTVMEISPSDWEKVLSVGEKSAASIKKVLLYRLPLRHNFRGIWERNGLLFLGDHGWSEFAPFWTYGSEESARWLQSAILGATQPVPKPLRSKIPVNVTIPVVGPQRAQELVKAAGGCLTAKVKVASRPDSQAQDLARVSAVREALMQVARGSGQRPRIRIDINATWSLAEARQNLPALNEAAGGLEYAEQPCWDPKDLVRLRQDKICPIAADEAIRRSKNPLQDLPEGAADVIVIKVQPLGGVKAAVKIAKAAGERGIKTVFSSALDSAVGIYQGLQAAAATPDLNLACGLATGQLFLSDVVKHRHRVEKGYLSLPNTIQPMVTDPELLGRKLGAEPKINSCPTGGEQLYDHQLLAQLWLDRIKDIFPYLRR